MRPGRHEVASALQRAGVRFVREYVLSNGFHGERYVFADRRTARAAERALGVEVRERSDRTWSVEYF